MTIYVIVRDAVYRHELGGAYSTLDKARVAARLLAHNEGDAHHRYLVIPCELDDIPAQHPVDEDYRSSANGGAPQEREALFVCDLNGDR